MAWLGVGVGVGLVGSCHARIVVMHVMHVMLGVLSLCGYREKEIVVLKHTFR